jgi:hypothetical protein
MNARTMRRFRRFKDRAVQDGLHFLGLMMALAMACMMFALGGEAIWRMLKLHFGA